MGLKTRSQTSRESVRYDRAEKNISLGAMRAREVAARFRNITREKSRSVVVHLAREESRRSRSSQQSVIPVK